MKHVKSNLINPDLDFINRLTNLSKSDFKKCMQCATCSVACELAPDNNPFPRKEILYASWGLKNNLLSDHDIWLCHQCGDCNTLCPRGVKPGDVLGAIRTCTIEKYAGLEQIGRLFKDPSKIVLLFILPALLFVILGLVTGLLDFTPDGDKIVHSHFFSHWLVEIIFIPLSIWVIVIFTKGVKHFLVDVHENALQEGKTALGEFDTIKFARSLIEVVPDIFLHRNFYKCTRNQKRAISHQMVFFSFMALAMVAGLLGAALHLLSLPGPYSQLNPIKWVANLAGVTLVVGSLLMIKERLSDTNQTSVFGDWYLLGLVFCLGFTGLLVEFTRLIDAAYVSYGLYFVHLVLAFNLIAFLPFTKLAHLIYRTVSIAYDKYIERDFGI